MDSDVTVPPKTIQTALDLLLAKFPDTSRRQAKEWISTGRVTVGGEVVRRPYQVVGEGSTVELLPKISAPRVIDTKWQIHPRVTLRYLDDSLAVIDKSAGMLSVPSPSRELSALSVLADFVAGRLHPRQRGTLEQEKVRRLLSRLTPQRVHRLDLYTSGLICFAMNSDARTHLIEQFRTHTARRRYVAFVDGKLSRPSGTWQHRLLSSEDEGRQHVIPERQAKSRKNGVVEAVSHYEVLKEFVLPSRRIITKLRLTLETGRTHQIRAQAAAMGVPLVGDRLYHPAYAQASSNQSKRFLDFDRQALHAERLELRHPREPHALMQWTSPLPADLRDLERRLQSESA